jgi:hypothetical protein
MGTKGYYKANHKKAHSFVGALILEPYALKRLGPIFVSPFEDALKIKYGV